jgi:FkbH-like protein
MVFLDDNPAERSEVKRELPMVGVPEFPEDVFELESFALAVYDSFFRTDKVLAEDLTKSEMYIANAERSKLKASFSDIDSFLKSLDMTLAIGAVDEGTINRAAQMTQKTNQFNLTTKRYSDSDIIDMISNNNVRIYIGKVKDRFGDNGITNLCIVNINGEKAEIDEF